MHVYRVVTFDKMGHPAVSLKQFSQLLMGYAGKDRRVINLVAIQMQDW